MLSLTQFRKNLFSIVKLLSSSGLVLEIVYNGEVYDVSILKTDKVPNVTRPRRLATPEVRQIDMAVCAECGSMMFNQICMNRQCIHSTGSLLAAKAQMQSQPEQDQ